MSTQFLLEAGLRSLVMGITLFVALRLLRVHQVRAQRTAWLLALAAAFMMPVLVSAHIGPRLLPDLSAVHRGPVALSRARTAEAPATIDRSREIGSSSPAITAFSHKREVPSAFQPVRPTFNLAAILYFGVAGFLLARLITGFALALRLRSRAHRATFALDAASDIRISNRLTTPVTIASTILLPASSVGWDPSTLRIVLTHERAHVRQHDFFIQLLAGLHSALFWFNPFSWWLQRRLSSLGEALSDFAAVAEAGSRTSYAEVLLTFATGDRWPLAGVAMARTSNLRPRVERLLSDRLFRESSFGRPYLRLLTGALAVLIFAVCTAIPRVHAAQAQAPAPPAQPQPAPVPPETGVAHPPEADAVPPAPPVPEASSSDGKVSISLAPSEAVANSTYIRYQGNSSAHGSSSATASSTPASGFSYANVHNDDVFALVSGSDSFTFTGDVHAMRALEAIRPSIQGNFIFYRHNGKSYVIQDPAILARAQALFAPMKDLEQQQDVLGKQQEALGKQQEELGRQQEGIKVPAPNLEKQLAELDAAEQKLRKMQNVDMESLSELQGEIAEIQGRLGELQGIAGEQQGKIGEKQGELGEKQGKLGEEQGRIGEQLGKIAEDAERQLKPLLDRAIRDGNVKPID